MAIQREAENHLISLIPKVCESDFEVAMLEQQVRELRTKVTAQRQAKRSMINGENCAKDTKDSFVAMVKTEANKFSSDAPHLYGEHSPTSYVSPPFSSSCAKFAKQKVNVAQKSELLPTLTAMKRRAPKLQRRIIVEKSTL